MNEQKVFVVTVQYYVHAPAEFMEVLQTETAELHKRGCPVIDIHVDQISPNTAICTRCNKRPAVVFGLSDNLCDSCQATVPAHLR